MTFNARILIPTLLLLSFAGIADGQEVDTTPIVLGTEAAYPPYSFEDEDGNADGMNAELARAMCGFLDRDCSIVVGEWADIRAALARGEVDAIVGMFYSPERHLEFEFSQPFTRVQHFVVSTDGSPPISSVDAIRGARIAVMEGDLMHEYAVRNGLTDRLLLFPTVSDAVIAVSEERADHALSASLPALHAVESLGLSDISLVLPVGEPVRYTVAALHDRAALLFSLSEALAALTVDGTYDTIRDRWLGPYQSGPTVEEILRRFAFVAGIMGAVVLAAFLWIRALRTTVSTRTKALGESRERVAHLNSVLLAIRNVNQLISQTQSREHLFADAVRTLTETRGYMSAWIMVLPRGGREVALYESEVGPSAVGLRRQLERRVYPKCVRDVLAAPPLSTTSSPQRECVGCPLASVEGPRGAITSVVRHKDVIYGALCVSVPETLDTDPEEQTLVLDVAGDLAYALHDIELGEERTRLEARLEMANRIVEQSPIVLLRRRPEEGWPVSYVSTNVCQFGYASEDLLSGETPYADIVHPSDLTAVAATVSANIERRHDVFTIEYRVVDPQGMERWISDDVSVIRDRDDQVASLNGVLHDITDRRRHEQDLEFQALVLDQINDQIAVTSPDGDISYANSAQARALRTAADQLVGRHVTILGDDVDAGGPHDEILVRTMRNGSWVGTVVRINPSGNRVTVRLRTGLLRSLSDEVVGMVFIGTDISELSRAQEDMERSRARLRALFDSAQDLMYLQDSHGIVTHANESLARFTRRNVEAIVGGPRVELGDDTGRWLEEDARVMSGVSVRTESTVLRSGRLHILETIRAPVFDREGSIIGLCGVARDVTDSVETRSRLATMAREKEVLLRELYHRTKNNMQVVASMVALKRYGSESEETGDILLELEARIYAIALVHQKLYQSHDLSRIDLADYIGDLVEQIEASFGFSERRISIQTDLDTTEAIIDQAVPIGLALNELLSNASKHAFENRESGTVSIRLRSVDGSIMLTVADDGVGMSEAARSDPAKIGLQTLYALVEMQLAGAIQCEVESGTRWTLTIPKSKSNYAPRQ